MAGGGTSLVSNAAATTSAAAAAVGEVPEADTHAGGSGEASSEEAANTHARAQLAQAVTVLLAGLGEDPTREGLRETPQVAPSATHMTAVMHVDSRECCAVALTTPAVHVSWPPTSLMSTWPPPAHCRLRLPPICSSESVMGGVLTAACDERSTSAAVAGRTLPRSTRHCDCKGKW